MNPDNREKFILEPNKRSLTYGTSRMDPPIQLVDRLKEIESAHEFIQTQTHSKLELILKQIRNLQLEAQKIIEKSIRDAELHSIPCQFEKKIGGIYHLYQRPDGTKYFSMLSPEDWNNNPPHLFLGSYELKPDRSFEEVPQPT